MKHRLEQAQLFLICCVATSALLISPALAQVNGPGPSPSNLFNVVLNLPGDEDVITGADDESIGGVSGQTTQLNVSAGGTVGWRFFADSGSEVNISGGEVLGGFDAGAGSEVNVSGGTLGSGAIAFDGSVMNISGGVVGDSCSAFSGGVVNISGGTVGNSFFTTSGSTVNISGGTVGENFDAFDGSVVNISGGTVGHFSFVSGEVNISGGTVERDLRASSGSAININGGTLKGDLVAISGGEVSISGGTLEGALEARSGSVVNIEGSAFSIDGTPVNNLQLGQSFTITDRDVTLSGVLADGGPFSFDLDPDTSFSNPGDGFSPDATLTVTLVDPLLLGDCNQDGVLNFQDIGSFIAILSSDSFLAQADCNQDGVVNFLDIQPFIQILGNA